MLLASLFLAIAQIQAGWLQHDFGHCSVFKSAFWNQAAHYLIISHMKGASSWWWKSKHNRHHSKTNIVCAIASTVALALADACMACCIGDARSRYAH
jgi:fatty acid desaturase